MVIAADPRIPFDYILGIDRKKPRQEQTVFKLKILSPTEEAEIQDSGISMVKEQEFKFNLGKKKIQILKAGLVGWNNFKDRDGKDVLFNTDKNGEPTDESLSRLRPEWRTELANAITEQNTMSEEEIKN